MEDPAVTSTTSRTNERTPSRTLVELGEGIRSFLTTGYISTISTPGAVCEGREAEYVSGTRPRT